MSASLYPLRLEPVLHPRVWGGTKLAGWLHKTLPGTQPCGEAWELHDTARVANGPLAGRSIGDLVQQYGTDLIGAGNDPAQGMPLLVKFLDAADWLSVQVHPDDAQALHLEGDPRGKTEAWIILAAEPGAKLVIGVQPGTDRATMTAAIQQGRLEDLLVYAPVQAGDVMFVRANTIHALGPGLLIYEIQQSSDVTYRLYDWNRPGLDGQPRPLHIDKGVAVSRLEAVPPIVHHPQDGVLVECPYFVTTQHTLDGTAPLTLPTDGRFQALTCIGGHLALTAGEVSIDLAHGQSALIPAALPRLTLTGAGRVLRSCQPSA
ncbi:MAG: class I mannose-6-phosphate isomerase [Anaerolineae bacterium]|jgi:mannose-6-phosphate isomerase|nr:class I mannose-6-phosphate isomerase [Anaerolineae bacterium]